MRPPTLSYGDVVTAPTDGAGGGINIFLINNIIIKNIFYFSTFLYYYDFLFFAMVKKFFYKRKRRKKENLNLILTIVVNIKLDIIVLLV